MVRTLGGTWLALAGLLAGAGCTPVHADVPFTVRGVVDGPVAEIGSGRGLWFLVEVADEGWPLPEVADVRVLHGRPDVEVHAVGAAGRLTSPIAAVEGEVAFQIALDDDGSFHLGLAAPEPTTVQWALQVSADSPVRVPRDATYGLQLTEL